MGILAKTALLSWLVTVFTMAVFVAVILPSQKRTFLDNLESKARGVSVSLQEIAAGAVVTEDFSEVVDHCMEVLSGDETIEHLVLTRNDGFALIHTRSGWRNEQQDAWWRPVARTARRGVGRPAFLDTEVFQYSRPFDYSGLEWGWIHVGLSLDSYRANVKTSYTRTALAAVLCIVMGLAASVFYAQRITTPVLRLRDAVQRVAEGDLSARAVAGGGDEVEVLAHAFNAMTQAVQDRESRIRAQNQRLAELVVDKALHAGDFLEASRRITEAGAETLGVDLAGVWLFNADRSRLECLDRFRLGDATHTRGDALERTSHEAYFAALDDARTIAASDAASDPVTSCLASGFLEPRGTGALLAAPIRLAGRVEGVICHEHAGGVRDWTPEEENFVGSVADLLALALEARDRIRARDELVAAKEAAEAASEAKSQFLANMSHEIRTPINGVMGMLQLLEQDELSARQHRYVGAALSSAGTLLTVIGDVLDFSKIEAGRFELDRSPFSLRDAVDRAVRLFAERAEVKGAELSYAVSQELPDRLVGDSSRFQQVLINLVGNAVKFIEQGSVHVQCRLAERSEGHAAVQCSVHDTGPGIPPDQRERIFESFAQGDTSMQRRHGGTGLGLAICRHLVGLMGGEIGVESAAGAGSTFWFTARFELQEEDGLARVHRPRAPEGLRLLVVDDSQAARKVVTEHGRAWGFRVGEASNASEAMDELQRAVEAEAPYSLALIDGRMPGIDGFDLARLIRDDPRFSATKLILLSGFQEPSSGALEQHGIAAVVPKPVRASQLYDAIAATTAEGDLEAPEPVGGESRGGADQEAAAGRILVVEDHPINQEVVRELIERLGYACRCLSTGVGVVEAVASGSCDLVLMDCQMPGLDGYEATRQIRAWETGARAEARIPVIAVTAHALAGDRERCLAAGMDDYLSKPIRGAELADMLGRWLERAGPRAAAAVDPALGVVQPETGRIGHDGDREREIVARCQGNRTLAAKLVRDFVVQTAEDIAAISRAAKEGDAARVARAAHRVKGAAGNLGLDVIAAIAEELVQMGKGGRFEPLGALLARLAEEVDEVAVMPLIEQASGGTG